MFCKATHHRVRKMARSEAKRMAAANAVSINSIVPSQRERRWGEVARPVVIGDLGALSGRANPAFAYWLVAWPADNARAAD